MTKIQSCRVKRAEAKRPYGDGPLERLAMLSTEGETCKTAGKLSGKRTEDW